MKPDFTDKPFQNFHTEYTAVIPPENFNSAINSMPGFDLIPPCLFCNPGQ